MRSQNFLQALLHQRQLCWRLSQREVSARYRGSAIGMAWNLINPIFMLAIYTFVFSTVFKSRWGNLEDTGPIGIAINLFVGLIVFNLYAECVSKGPTFVLCRPNFVTKVVFLLEILPLVTVALACFQALSSLAILGIFELIVIGRIPLSISMATAGLATSDLLLASRRMNPGSNRRLLKRPRTSHRSITKLPNIHECCILSLQCTAGAMAAIASPQPPSQL